MTEPQLIELVKDFTVFLEALDKVIPEKVDDELITFLKSIESQPWIPVLLLNAMNLVKAQEVKPNKR